MGPQPLRGLKASQKINVITGFCLVIALFVMYLTTLHIDGLARSRYSVQRHHSVGARSAGDPPFNVLRRDKVHTKVIEGKLDKTYWENINSTLEYIFQYRYSLPSDNALSVRVESLSATKDNPVLVVVRQQAGILSWQLPFILESSSVPKIYHSVSRTLCPNQQTNGTEEGEKEFFLGVSTSNPTNITFSAGYNIRN